MTSENVYGSDQADHSNSHTRRRVLQAVGISSIVGLTGVAGCIQGSGGDGGGNGSSGNGSGDGGGSDQLRLGIAFPKTGGAYKVFKDGLLGQRMAIKDINDAGGVNVGGTKRKIKKIETDGGCSPDGARSALTKLVNQQNVDVLSGPLCSGGVLGSMSISKKNTVPQVVMASNPKITKPGTRHEWIWRAHETSAMRANLMAKYHAKTSDRVAFIGLNNSFGTSAINAYKEKYKSMDQSVNVVKTVLFEDDTTQFQTQLSKIKSANPDIVHAVTDKHEQVLGLTEQAHKTGLDSKAEMTAEPEWGKFSLSEDISTEALKGWVVVSAWSPTQQNKLVQNFVDKFEKRQGHVPGFLGPNGYDLIYILKNAIEKAGSTDEAKIQKALNELEYGPGVYGGRTWAFNKHGQADIDPFLIRWSLDNGSLTQNVFAKGPDDL